jgi:hypothetical protein
MQNLISPKMLVRHKVVVVKRVENQKRRSLNQRKTTKKTKKVVKKVNLML